MIADPMADLGNGPAGGTSGEGNEMGTTKEVVDPMAMSMNVQRIERIKNVMSIVSGCVAGICGLTGFSGFGTSIIIICINNRERSICRAHGCFLCSSFNIVIVAVCFILWHLLVCASIWVIKMGGNLTAYTKQSWLMYLTAGLQQFAMSFTLFWTFFYGLVYLY